VICLALPCLEGVVQGRAPSTVLGVVLGSVIFGLVFGSIILMDVVTLGHFLVKTLKAKLATKDKTTKVVQFKL
jgi:hypothetical protein